MKKRYALVILLLATAVHVVRPAAGDPRLCRFKPHRRSQRTHGQGGSFCRCPGAFQFLEDRERSASRLKWGPQWTFSLCRGRGYGQARTWRNDRSRHKTDLLSNTLVLITDRETGTVKDIDGLRSLLDKAELLAIGNPDSVPAGRYAVQALTSFGLYAAVQKKLVFWRNGSRGPSIRRERFTPLGIVYATDALSVNVGSHVRQISHSPRVH